jgi:hypothetical protein
MRDHHAGARKRSQVAVDQMAGNHTQMAGRFIEKKQPRSMSYGARDCDALGRDRPVFDGALSGKHLNEADGAGAFASVFIGIDRGMRRI